MVERVKCEDLEKIVVDNDEKKFFPMGVQLPPWEKEELVVFLMKYVYVFAWSTYEVPGMDPNFICHHQTLIHLSPLRSNHLGALPKSILMLLRKR